MTSKTVLTCRDRIEHDESDTNSRRRDVMVVRVVKNVKSGWGVERGWQDSVSIGYIISSSMRTYPLQMNDEENGFVEEVVAGRGKEEEAPMMTYQRRTSIIYTRRPLVPDPLSDERCPETGGNEVPT